MVDASFISLRLIIPPLVDVVEPNADLIALVKPQFEVGKENLPPDGVVKNEADRDATLDGIRQFIESDTPWTVIGEMESPIEGEKGNLEYLLHLR